MSSTDTTTGTDVMISGVRGPWWFGPLSEWSTEHQSIDVCVGDYCPLVPVVPPGYVRQGCGVFLLDFHRLPSGWIGAECGPRS